MAFVSPGRTLATADWQKKAAGFLHFLLEKDFAQYSPITRIAVHPVRVAARAVEEFFNDKCLQSASALAFASLLALVPVTAIFFIFLTQLQAFGEIQLKVEDFLFQNLVPARTDIIREYVSQYTQNIRLLGVFGIITLFITAIFLFNTIEHTINDIWHAKQRRPFLSKFMAFCTVLTATPVLAGISFWITTKLAVQQIDIFELKFLIYLLNWIAFWFAYQFVPYTRVRYRAAIIGAVVGGTLWELAKQGFNWYIANMTAFDKIYGSLGAVPMFLIWIYLTWLIVLFGAEVAYAVQYPSEKTHIDHARLTGYLDFYAVRAMAEIVKRFGENGEEPVSTMDRLKDIGIPSEAVGVILNHLSEKRLIVYTEDKNYVPARNPSTITVREVIEAVSGRKMIAPESGDDPVSDKLRQAFGQVADSVDSSLDKLNLQMLIDGRDT